MKIWVNLTEALEQKIAALRISKKHGILFALYVKLSFDLSSEDRRVIFSIYQI